MSSYIFERGFDNGMNERQKVRLAPIRVIPNREIAKSFLPTIEITGNGNLLCYEGFFGRWFRSSEVCVREAIAKFVDLYEQGNYLNYNDLYSLFNIAVTHVGNEYGYSASEDYKCDLEFDITRIPADENFEGMNEEVLVIEPAGNYCYPFDCYMEV